MIYAIHGRKRSGKDTIARMIMEHTGCAPYAFADPIHRGLHHVLKDSVGLSLEDCKGFTDFNRDEFIVKDVDLVIPSALNWCHNQIQFSDPDAISERMLDVLDELREQGDVTFRQLMQTMGTDIVVHVERDYWLRWIPLNSDVIFTDVRQQHELDFVRNQKGVCVFVYRDMNTGDTDHHVTERGLEPTDGDIIIKNNGTLDELMNAINHKVLIHHG